MGHADRSRRYHAIRLDAQSRRVRFPLARRRDSHPNTNRKSDRNCHGNANSYSAGNSNANSNSYGYNYSHGYSYPYGNTNIDSQAYAYTEACANSEAAPDAGAQAVILQVIGN
jgi:hypothetical protein